VAVANPLTGLIGKGPGTIGQVTIPTIDLGFPFLGLLGEGMVNGNATSNYSALQITVRHAYSNGLTVLANYTWSKATGMTGGTKGASFEESEDVNYGGTNVNSGGIDYVNLNNDRGVQSYNFPQRAVFTAVYALPFSKGQKLAPSNGFARAITSGWQIAPVITLQSGAPWGPNCGGLNGRCDIVPNEPMYVPKNLQHYYNGKTAVSLPDGRSITPAANTYLLYNPDRYAAPIAAFANGKYAVDQYWWGQTAMYPNGLHSPWWANVDLSLQRAIPIHERLQLLIRADATNAFNRTTFFPNAVQGGGGAVTAVGSSLGLNSSIATGSMTPTFYAPRMITLSGYLRF